MSVYTIFQSSTTGILELDTDGTDASFKKIMGKVHTKTTNEWSSEHLTSSFRYAAVKIISKSLPSTPPATVAAATTFGMLIQTGSTVVSDLPPDGGGRVYCVKDAADSSGTTWVTVLTGAIAYLSSQGRHFNSTGSDKDFIIADWVAPWHTAGSSTTTTAYEPKVYAVWKTAGSSGGSIAAGPDTITEISSSNKAAWIFNYDAGVLKFVNPTLAFTFTNFLTFEENVAALSSYTDAGWKILSQTKTTTEHVITIGGGWASGSLVSPTWKPLSDIITANTGALTSSCFAVSGYRYIGPCLG